LDRKEDQKFAGIVSQTVTFAIASFQFEIWCMLISQIATHPDMRLSLYT